MNFFQVQGQFINLSLAAGRELRLTCRILIRHSEPFVTYVSELVKFRRPLSFLEKQKKKIPTLKMVNLGDVFPNFSADTTVGAIKFHEWIGNSWAILFSHPADFTPVCTTELGQVAKLASEFEKRGVKLIALSCDDVDSHNRWIEDIKVYACLKGEGFPFPIISDKNRDLAVSLGMVDPDEKDKEGLPLTCRAVFIIGPDKRMKLSMLYPASTGRNFDEVLRVVDALQLTYKNNVATPVNWQVGGDCMVLPNIKDEDLPKLFPKGVTVKEVPSKKSYLRITPQP